ncbi:M13 family metallopeptidase [Sandarakinorhabdus rubra]|uniref:M13 family metallopeptidase n=1 Tax=Sandarakinorhabdus rubra TaxID=2672568 RepID=UPI0013DCB8CE|nr:M13 family metallopeptidase [Sandarakinorhabdus rubra]
MRRFLLALVLATASPCAVIAAETPAIGSFGFDTGGMDRSVKPGDDFNAFASGVYLKNLQIPADRAGAGPTYVLDDLSRERTRAIIEAAAAQRAAPGSTAQKVGDYYASFMDEAAIEAAGLTPLAPELDAIAAINDRRALSTWLGRGQVSGLNAPLLLGISADDKNPDQVAVTSYQGGLGLPEREYYTATGEQFEQARAAYRRYAAEMFRLAGLDRPEARADAVFALEAKIAAVHWTPAQSREADKTYNPATRAELAKLYPGLDWDAFLAGAQLGSLDRVVIAQTSAIAGSARLIESEPLAVWQDYARLRLLAGYAGVLPKAFVDTSFQLSRALTGQQVLRDRWKRGVDQTTDALGEAVGALYVERHFPPEAKAKTDALVKNIIAALDARLANLAWMAPETRAVARAKLAAFTPKIGYPDKWRDYAGLEVVKGDALGNRRRALAFEHARQVAKLGKPVDRSEWLMAPMEVNAYAYPVWNEIVFPAAILQPPFFDPKADDAVNYGAIGAVIGHEILHHFDDQGRKYDKTGRLADWWTKGDVERFETLAKALVDQYAAYEPLPGKRIDGQLTLGENIADVAGLQIAWDAWKRSLGGKPAPVIDGFTGEQRFFLGFAQVWRGKYREPLQLQLLTSDPHSPNRFRAQTVRNLDAWYQAFGVKPGDKLYLPPDKRVKIW